MKPPFELRAVKWTFAFSAISGQSTCRYLPSAAHGIVRISERLLSTTKEVYRKEERGLRACMRFFGFSTCRSRSHLFSLIMSTAVSLASAQRANQVKDTAKLFFVDLPPECQEIAFQHLANTYEEKSLAALEQTAVVPSKVARPFLYPTMTWLDKVVKTRKQVALEKKQLEVFVSSKKRELIKSACTPRPYPSYLTNPSIYISGTFIAAPSTERWSCTLR